MEKILWYLKYNQLVHLMPWHGSFFKKNVCFDTATGDFVKFMEDFIY